ncbi:hypothetical protein G6038_09795 [Rhodococcus sp. 14C212]|uniref:hypothetical protein n=1 Tax=Rhodococcus sp. 14C212 TaxID=2711209 RepID=UPI0013EADACC|nr:hypothetical protein [Rhodococcus sp. 14C212]NGP05767.1 hypothetical protein [Rhodococcus sp. 14C212]
MTNYMLPPPHPAEMSIFALQPAAFSEEVTIEIAERFGLSGGRQVTVLHRHPEWLAITQGSLEVRVFRGSGGWCYRNRAIWQVDDGESHLEITDETGVELAMKYVRELELADQRELRLLKVTRLHVGVTDRAADYAEERVIDLGVAFQRVIDGVPVEGPGGKIVVYIDHRGVLTGVDRLWRALGDKQAVSEFQPLQVALDDLESTWGHSEDGTMVVEEARLAYYELGWEHAQEYMQPAYILPIRITSRGAKPFTTRSEHIFPAALNSVGPLFPSAARVEPQNVRQSSREV